MKQSSIDWLIYRMENTRFPTPEEKENMKQTAREMHRQEIEKAYNMGWNNREYGYNDNYYTETFKQP